MDNKRPAFFPGLENREGWTNSFRDVGYIRQIKQNLQDLETGEIQGTAGSREI